MANAKVHRPRLPESQTLTGGLVLGAILAVALTAATVIAAPMPQAEANEVSSPATDEFVDVPTQISQSSSCDHFWVEGKKTVQHPVVTHDVAHEAVYEQTSELHSVCNDCKAEIDGIAAQHLIETGHSGYTTGVLLQKCNLVQPAWTETVVDSEAWVEEVPDGTIICTLCGRTRMAGSSEEAGLIPTESVSSRLATSVSIESR